MEALPRPVSINDDMQAFPSEIYMEACPSESDMEACPSESDMEACPSGGSESAHVAQREASAFCRYLALSIA
eukprot:2011888-Amphidinium_carterae.2